MDGKDFREAMRAFERHYIINVLNKTNWNRIEAAREMNMHRNTLLMKMKDLGIKELADKKGVGPLISPSGIIP